VLGLAKLTPLTTIRVGIFPPTSKSTRDSGARTSQRSLTS
jgi:hypothetical protein